MAISDKLTYLNTTKSQLKDMINYGLPSEQQITSSTTFRNYVSSIFNAFLEALRTPDTLFTNLPKKSSTGANITLNDTANAPMRIELGASELSQAGTPTPSSPQAVHTISGSNKVVVEGKNLLSIDKLVVGGTYEYYKFKEVDDNSYYTLSIKLKNGGTSKAMSIGVADGTTPPVSHYNWLMNTGTISGTSQSDGFYSINNLVSGYYMSYIIIYKGSGNTLQDLFDNYDIQLVKGYTYLSYEPYISQEADIDLDTIEYCKIGNYEDKFIRNSGKNLANFPISTLPTTNTTIIDFGEDMTFDSITTSFYLNNAQYTNGSGGLVNYQKNDGTNQYILPGLYRNSSNTGMSANTTLNGQYSKTETNITFRKVIVTNYPSFTQGTMNIQVELGSSATDYEPYGSNEWYIKKNIGKVVLDGTNNALTFYNVNTNRSAGYIEINNLLEYISTEAINPPKLLSTHLVSVSQNSTWAEGNISMRYQDLNKIYICLTPSFTGASDMNNWLASNNVSVYYVLATPEYTQITGTLETQLENIYQKLLSYTGQTNISQVNNDLSFVFDVEAVEEI